MHAPRACATLAVLALVVALPAFGPAATAAATVRSATLPVPSQGHATVWDGNGHAYTFGSYSAAGGISDLILRYDTLADVATTTSSHLPTARRDMGAVWDGAGNAYIFGGVDGGGFLNQVVRYTPATGAVTTLAATLPTARSAVSAVWDGAGNAYLLGGYSGFTWSSQILRFTPATGTLTVMPTALPTARAGPAVWDGAGNAYMFGGRDATGTLDQVLKYTPATGTLTVLPTRLPERSAGAAAVWDGAGHAYILGGSPGIARADTILRFDAATGAIETMPDRLPDGVEDHSAIWDGHGRAFSFGGFGNAGELDTIVRYTVPVPLLTLPTMDLAALRLVVCESGSATGCAPGSGFLCAEIQPTLGTPTPLGCVARPLVPDPVAEALLGLSPVPVGPVAGAVQVSYTHDYAMLTPLASVLGQPPLCAPVPPGSTALATEGAEFGLILSLHVAGSAPTRVVVPYLGQLVAAALATSGAIPCGP